MKKNVKIILTFTMLMLLLLLTSVNAAAQQPDLGLEDYVASLPPEVSDSLEESGITPDNIPPDALSAQNVFDKLLSLVIGSLGDPIKLTVSIFTIVLLCGIANALFESAGKNMQSVFSIVSVLVGAAMLISPVSSAINAASELVNAGKVFLEGFIPAFAGILLIGGQVNTSVVINSVVMAGAQLFAILSSGVIVPASSCIMGVTIAGSVDPELKLNAIAEAAKKIVIWGLGLIMTVFVALLGLQSFITLPADGVAIKAARFTVSNGVPFIGGTVSDALSVMQGGINLIRSNFGSFGIVAGAMLMLPSMISAACFKLALSLCSAVCDMFGLPALGGLLKSAESIMSIILAVLVCFMLMVVISISLMIFIGMGGAA